jgi:tripartite-type tricarboxylate transporter receptor subunit TctC
MKNARCVPRRTVLSAGAAFIAAPWAYGQTPWQPTKLIRLVVGFPPGGTTDVMARVLSVPLGELLGQTVIVENRPGASGNIGTGEVVKAAADGYTLLLAPTSMETANPWLFKSSFRPTKDLVPVAGVGHSHLYLIAKPGLEAADAKSLVMIAKQTPGKLSYASAGAGTPPHLIGELFKQQTNTFITHIPYRGVAPALQDVMAGQVDYAFDPGVAFPHIRAGKVKLLAVAGSKRSPFFPDAPTLTEQGIKGVELGIAFGVWAPSGTPPEVTRRLNAELAKVLALPATRQRFADFAAEPVAPDLAVFRKLLLDEGKLLESLIKERKITIE